MPPAQYYEGDDLYYFDAFQTARERGTRRPRVETLYDVFVNVRDDEAESVSVAGWRRRLPLRTRSLRWA